MSLLLLLLLSLLQVSRQPAGVLAVRENKEDEILTEWVNSIRWMQSGVTSFDLSPGDSLDLNCRGMSYTKKIRVPLDLEWRLLDRLLTDEGSTGRMHLLEDNGRLTIENVNARDSGLYATYTNRSALTSVLDLKQPMNESSSSSSMSAAKAGAKTDRVAVCLFVVRIDDLRKFTLREGEVFSIDMSAWLTPLAHTLSALDMPQNEWSMAWYHEGEETISCRAISTCQLNFTASRGQTAGIWRLEMRSLVHKLAPRRMLLEFVMSVRPPLTYLDTFPLATHKYYMVYGSLMIALFLLTLHLFNNLNWTPFAFDVLPDQVSPKAVLDQAGVFLKETRV